MLAVSGAARGVIYHHFPGGKAELAREAVAWTGRSVRARLAALDADDPETVVALFLAAVRPVVAESAAGSGTYCAAPRAASNPSTPAPPESPRRPVRCSDRRHRLALGRPS
ncbi:MAG TPA: hypothetical protein VGH72_23420 [Pseudonocardia sp.]